MGQEISQQQTQQQQQQHHNHSHNHNHNHHQQPTPHHLKRQNQRKSLPATPSNQPIYTPTSNISSNSSVSNDNQNYRLRHKYNLTKQTYERTKILATAASNTSQSDTDSHYAKLNLQRSSSQSSDSGIYNSSCHCSSISSLSAVSSSTNSSRSSSTSSNSSRGCPSSLLSSKSNKSLDKQKHYLSHHLYIKSYLDILEEDERARAHFKSARPGGIRNYTPKILATSGSGEATSTNASLSSSAPAHCYGPGKRTSSASTVTGKHSQEDPWI